ncbi:lipopolysaccharide biosynthesis protein [Terrabacter aerolatus]|uniref:Lipopolysaccharide biosynthesis protein n=1 Tax=Terrabacter aerolatus TaxID=422442 RepID=A0A512D3N2_9MICO|nr:lipopolysaccharide biosynthesis protein [Terrabacter aerolatus]GEO31081.1 lipopolysaccharide biosynthesis protein [Terrabacter aerolatus]
MAPTANVATSTLVAHGTKLTALAQIATQGSRLLTNIVLARLLVPDDFGVVAIALVITMLMDQFKDAGTGSALIQQETISDSLTNAVFRLNIAIGLVMTLAVFFLAAPLSSLLGSTSATPFLQAMSSVVIIGSLGHVHNSLLRRELRFGDAAWVTTISALTNAVVAIGAALIGMGAWALVLGAVTSTAAGTVTSWRLSRWRPSRSADYRSLRGIMGYSLNLFGSNLMYFAFTQADKVLISRALGTAPLGAYALAQRTVMNPMQSVGSVVSEVVFPAFSRRQDDNAAVAAGFRRMSRVVALVTFPAMAGMAAVADPLVPVLFGEQWRDLIPLVWVLGPLAAVMSVTSNSSQLLMAKGQTRWILRWGILYGVLVIGAEIVGLRWGVVGVASAYALSTLVLTPFGLALAFHFIDLRLRTFLRDLVVQAALTIAMVGAVVASNTLTRGAGWSDIAVLATGMAVGTVTYVGLVALVRPPALPEAIAALKSRRPT